MRGSAAWNLQKIVVKDSHETLIATRPDKSEGVDVLRFDVPPQDAIHSISAAP